MQKFVICERDKIILAALDSLEVREGERILNPIGDGLYVALLAPPEKYDLHLRLAVEILRKLGEYNEHVGRPEKFDLRIGIDDCMDDLAPDINNKVNVVGDGANIASRIMGLADGGQILVSESVHRQLFKRQQYENKFRELPSKRVKHGFLVRPFQYVEEGVTGLNCELPKEWVQDASNQEQVMSRPAISSEAPAQVESEQDAGKSLTPSESQATQGEQQIADAVDALILAISNPEYASGIKLAGELDAFQLLRLQLLTSSWLESQISSSMLGTHESNRLYLNRVRLLPTRPELFSVLRMLINDASGYIPGWYWLKELEPQMIERIILHLALSDPLAFVRQQAFGLLYSASVPLPEGISERLSATVTSDAAPEVRRAATRYLGRVGTERHLPIVGSALVDREATVVYQAKESKYWILARTHPDRTLRELLGESRSDIDQILLELIPRINEIETSTLIDALGNANDDIRLFALKELAQRGDLTVESAASLKGDKDQGVKAEAYRFLIRRGVAFEPREIGSDVPDNRLGRWMSRKFIARRVSPIDRDEIIFEFYRRFNIDQLVEMTDWNEWSGHDAYRALACEHFADFGQRLREDLRTDFGSAGQKYYEGELTTWKEIAAHRTTTSNQTGSFPTISGSWSALWKVAQQPDESTPESSAQRSVESRKAYYIAAALAGLSRSGASEDVTFGRRLLFHTDEDVRIEAVKVITRCGSSEDVRDLIKVATTEDGLLQELAGRSALNLSDEPLVVARELLATGDEILTSLTLAELIALEIKGRQPNS